MHTSSYSIPLALSMDSLQVQSLSETHNDSYWSSKLGSFQAFRSLYIFFTFKLHGMDRNSSEPSQDNDNTNQPFLFCQKTCQVGRNWSSVSFIENGSNLSFNNLQKAATTTTDPKSKNKEQGNNHGYHITITNGK